MEVPRQIWLEVTIDPDGRDIKLDGRHDFKLMNPITEKVNVDPAFIGEIEIPDLKLIFNDSTQFFNPLSTDELYRPFRVAVSAIKTFTSRTSIELEYHYILNQGNDDMSKQRPYPGDMITITDGVNSNTTIISNVTLDYDGSLGLPPPIDQYAKYYCRLTLPVGGLTHDYSAGDIVSITPYVGKKVKVVLKVEGDSNDYTMMEGFIKHPLEWKGDEAILTIENLLGTYLRKDLRVKTSSPNPTQWVGADGNFTSSLSWAEGDTGSDPTITVYEDAFPGKWVVTFSDTTNFTVTGPNCRDKAGDINTDFYDQTDATDSQIKITASTWGSPSAGDKLTFYVSVNFDSERSAEIIYNLLVTYAGLSVDYLDAVAPITTIHVSVYGYSFNFTYNLFADELNLSFSDNYKIGEAIIAVQPHTMTYLATNATEFTLFRSRAYVEGSPTASTKVPGVPETGYGAPSAFGNPIENTIKTNGLQLYNQMIIKYGWDASTNSYTGVFIYPGPGDANPSATLYGRTVAIDIELPGYFDPVVVEKWAKRYYSIWAFDLVSVEQTTGYYNALTSANVGDAINGLDVGLSSTATIVNIEKTVGPQNRVKFNTIVYPYDFLGFWQ